MNSQRWDPPMGLRRDLIVCSLESWDEVWRRNQFLVAGLLQRDPALNVLFVEPAADPLHAALSRNHLQLGAGLRVEYGVSPRLHRLQMTKWLPRFVGPFADIRLRHRLMAVARQLGMVAPTLWVNDPSWARLTVNPAWPAIYDITDDWLAARRSEREHTRLVANEALLMSNCREVVVCSPGLAATKGRIRQIRLIPNAVDVGRYRRPHRRPADLPEAPTAVYVGTLHEDRLDIELCRALGSRLEPVGAALVLVGPLALSSANRQLLRASPGVTLLGPRPHESIPGYLQHATTLVVPHLVDDFTNSLDPIKLYEYQAVARPMVSTPVAGFRELAGEPGVTVADAEVFVDAVLATLEHPPAVGPFTVPDWSERVAAMDQTLLDARSS